ncbi:hypothetical protein F441_18345, partial [Phytophthora nicotianae CJ01A1]
QTKTRIEIYCLFPPQWCHRLRATEARGFQPQVI